MKTMSSFNYIGNNISMPEALWDEIDKLTMEWQSNRSAVLRRVFQEWKTMRSAEIMHEVKATSDTDPELSLAA